MVFRFVLYFRLKHCKNVAHYAPAPNTALQNPTIREKIMINTSFTFKTALIAVLGRMRQGFIVSPRRITAAAFIFLFLSGIIVTPVSASSVYYNFSGGSLNTSINAATVNNINTNDIWTGVPSVEGYCGNNLTNTHGVDPQTVLTSEFATLPSSANTCVAANKGNPSAFNAGGLAEFDDLGDPYLAIGFQGNVQANPYLVFYLNTVGQTTLRISYVLTDIDGGSNDSVSSVALQYRVGETGNFTNLPDGYAADITDKNVAGRVTSRSVLLPAAALNVPKLQIRLLSTNAAGADGKSTPDEWIGVNNIVISNLGPTAANATVGGRVFNPFLRPLSNATILMYDNTGGVRTARSNTFGFYRFDGVSVGDIHTFEVRSKRYTFAEPVKFLSVSEDTDSLDFYAEQPAQFWKSSLKY